MLGSQRASRQTQIYYDPCTGRVKLVPNRDGAGPASQVQVILRSIPNADHYASTIHKHLKGDNYNSP